MQAWKRRQCAGQGFYPACFSSRRHAGPHGSRHCLGCPDWVAWRPVAGATGRASSHHRCPAEHLRPSSRPVLCSRFRPLTSMRARKPSPRRRLCAIWKRAARPEFHFLPLRGLCACRQRTFCAAEPDFKEPQTGPIIRSYCFGNIDFIEEANRGHDPKELRRHPAACVCCAWSCAG